METEIKSAYDNYNQSLDRDGDDGSGSESELEPTDASDTLDEPPKQKANEESSVLAGIAKVVNKPQKLRWGRLKPWIVRACKAIAQ